MSGAFPAWDAPTPLLIGFSGLLIGSFLNVVIHRLPLMMQAEEEGETMTSGGDERRLSLAWPSSRCPLCERPIRPVENIPLLSYLGLRGRCAGCGGRISPVYPVVEALSAALPVGTALLVADAVQAWAAAVIVWFLIPAVAIDLRLRLLPDALTLPLLWAGLAASAIFRPFASPEAAILGAVGGYGLLFAVSWAAERYYGRPALGLGDAKLLAALGAWLGWPAPAPVVFLAAVLGAAAALPGLLTRRLSPGAEIPFGPMLAVAGLVVMARPEYFAALGMTLWR